MVGKIAGLIIGVLLTRHIAGGLVGLYIGHMCDKVLNNLNNRQKVEDWLQSEDSKQAIFFYTTFSVMGHVAKSSGRVTNQHIETATKLMSEMRLDESQKAEAKEAFREGKLPGFPVKKKLGLFKRHFAGRQDLAQFFLEIQIQTAYCDSVLEDKEYKVLLTIAKQLGFNKRTLDQLVAMWEAEMRFQAFKQQKFEQHKKYDRHGEHKRQRQQQTANSDSVKDAYAILGVSERDSAREIKRAYKRLMAQNHPDKLVAKGLPPEMMEMAKRKTQDIQYAYELLKKEKNL